MKHNYVVGKPHILNKSLFLKRVEDILDSKTFSNNGPYVKELENELSYIFGFPNVITTNNATSALDICLAFLKKSKPFGKIIVPSFTFVSTIQAIVRAGFEPLFCDIDDNYCIDTQMAMRQVAMSPDVVGIIPCNLFGNLCDFEEINALNLFTIVDSAHAFSLYDEASDYYSGHFGDCEVFSLHPTKLLSAMEGGIITTHNKELADFAVKYRNFGFDPNAGLQGNVVEMGSNFKLSEIQAAAILTQLNFLEDIQIHYFDRFQDYKKLLSDWVKLSEPNIYFSNYSYVVCRVHPTLRNPLVNYLTNNGIYARTYFQPVHLMEPFREKYGHLSLPNTERIAKQVFALPTGLNIQTEDVKIITDIIRSFIDGSTGFIPSQF